MRAGPKTRAQLQRLGREWQQGEHILLSGPTGSGKTTLAREIVQLRLDRGGFVVVFVFKPIEDPTIIKEYAGWTRWKNWKKNPSAHERKVLMWPDTDKAKGNKSAILDIQKHGFSRAFDGINHKGRWTVQFDDGLYLCSPTFLNMADELAMSHAIGRSGDITAVTLAQRPSNLPLILYGSASHAIVGQTREATDLKRLAELGAKEGSKALGVRIADQDRHDFQWVPVAPGWPAEHMNLSE